MCVDSRWGEKKHKLLQDREGERNIRGFILSVYKASVPGPTSQSISDGFAISEFLYLAAQASQKGLVFIAFCLP